MATKKKAVKAAKAGHLPAKDTSFYHELNSLLHSVRCIAQHEDALCELTHAVRGSGVLTAEAAIELRAILDKIPAQDYLNEVEAVRVSLRACMETARRIDVVRLGK